jgi:hypothetical protein
VCRPGRPERGVVHGRVALRAPRAAAADLGHLTGVRRVKGSGGPKTPLTPCLRSPVGHPEARG